MVNELAYHIFIQATAQDVWDALTGPGLTRKCGYRTLVKCDPQPGGIYLAYASGRRYGQRAGDLIISGEVLEAEPPKRLVQTWHPMFDARAAACDPDVLRAYTAVAALTAMPADVLAEPGMLDKVISVGSAAPRYSVPGPARADSWPLSAARPAAARRPRSARR